MLSKDYFISVFFLILQLSSCKDPLSSIDTGVGDRVFSSTLISKTASHDKLRIVAEDAFEQEGIILVEDSEVNWFSKYTFETDEIQLLVDIATPKSNKGKVSNLYISAHVQSGVDKNDPSVRALRDKIKKAHKNLDKSEEIKTYMFFNLGSCWIITRDGEKKKCNS